MTWARSGEFDAVVVGSGPNGLAAAAPLARAGLAVTVLASQPDIGGGARTVDLGLAPGITHHLCAAAHALAAGSPFVEPFEPGARAVELVGPEASYVQPLDPEPAAIAWRDVERTADGLGGAGCAWRSTLGDLAANWRTVAQLSLGDKRSIPPGVLDPRALPEIGRAHV